MNRRSLLKSLTALVVGSWLPWRRAKAEEKPKGVMIYRVEDDRLILNVEETNVWRRSLGQEEVSE